MPLDFDKNITEFVCTRLQQTRVEKNVTVKEVSEATGIPCSTLSTFFSNPGANPSFYVVANVSLALEISLDDVIAEACGIPPEPEAPPIPEEVDKLRHDLELSRLELENAKQLLAKTEEQIELCKTGIAERKPVIYGLCGLTILAVSMLLIFIVRDAMVPTQGLIRADGISQWIAIGVFVFVCLALYIAHHAAKRRKK